MQLLALDGGPDIPVVTAIILVGRHPGCDTRLDSTCVSRRHCCLAPVGGELEVRDLSSTNGVRINGRRVLAGRLRPGDELWIAHLRYRLDGGPGLERALADPGRPGTPDGRRPPCAAQPPAR
jgi:hypothetical protein